MAESGCSVYCSQSYPSEAEMKLLDLLSAILQNLSMHPENRTKMYRAELAGTAALDRVLEGPSSPEPTDTAATLLATRLNGAVNTSAVSSSLPRAESPTSRYGARSPSPNPGGRQPQQTAGDSATLTKSLDSTMSVAAVLRPKVVFPPICKMNEGRLDTYEAPGLSSQCSPAGDASAWPTSSGHGQPGNAAGASMSHRPQALVPPSPTRGNMGPRSSKSRGAAISVAAMPGSPTVAPDSREQFLIWMDNTFFEVNERNSGKGAHATTQDRR